MNADEGYAGDLDALRYVKCMGCQSCDMTAYFAILWFVVVSRMLCLLLAAGGGRRSLYGEGIGQANGNVVHYGGWIQTRKEKQDKV